MSGLKFDLPRRNDEDFQAMEDRAVAFNSNATAIEMLMAKIGLVVEICEKALLSDDSEIIKAGIQDAKKWYADALRSAGRLSFSVEDVEAFEFRTVRLEDLISKLERRFVFQSAATRRRRS